MAPPRAVFSSDTADAALSPRCAHTGRGGGEESDINLSERRVYYVRLHPLLANSSVSSRPPSLSVHAVPSARILMDLGPVYWIMGL